VLAAPLSTTHATLSAVGRRASVLGMAALGAALAAVYAGAAITLPAGQGGLVVALCAVAVLELAWVVGILRLGPRRGVLGCGLGLQVVLVALWSVSRTVGLPGQGVLGVGELDVICLLDELVVGALAVSGLRRWSARSSLWALGPCQLAVTLAGATLFAWGGGHVHTAQAAGAGIHFGAPAQVRYFCHLL
jgi:hypothetical protein